MQGLGNDFVVIDQSEGSLPLTVEHFQRLSNRRLGIGCDQIMLIEKSTVDGIQFQYRVVNCDGSDAEQCGNGARCVAWYLFTRQMEKDRQFEMASPAGVVEVDIDDADQVSLNMGVPQFDPKRIPFVAEQFQHTYPLTVLGETEIISAVSIGNPHVVLRVNDIGKAHVARKGAAIGDDERFLQGVNVGFMEVVSREHIRLRVFERGVGETLACGSGACAAMAVGRLLEVLEDTVTVELKGGAIVVKWLGEGQPLYMTGAAQEVFGGVINL